VIFHILSNCVLKGIAYEVDAGETVKLLKLRERIGLL